MSPPLRSAQLLQRYTKAQILGIKSLLFPVPASHKPQLLPPLPIWSYVQVELLLGSETRWKSLGAKSGKYGACGNTSYFKSWVCFTVCRAVWIRSLLCCRHTPQDNRPRRFLPVACYWTFHCSLFFFAPRNIHESWFRFVVFIWMTFVFYQQCEL